MIDDLVIFPLVNPASCWPTPATSPACTTAPAATSTSVGSASYRAAPRAIGRQRRDDDYVLRRLAVTPLLLLGIVTSRSSSRG